MDVALLRPAYQVAMAIAHTGKVQMLRLLSDSDFALVEGRTAADLFVADRGKNNCSEATVDRAVATAVEETGCGCSLLAKTLLEMIDRYQWFAASANSSVMRSADCSSPHERLRFAHRIHLAPSLDLS